jgi:hypothetical protein
MIFEFNFFKFQFIYYYKILDFKAICMIAKHKFIIIKLKFTFLNYLFIIFKLLKFRYMYFKINLIFKIKNFIYFKISNKRNSKFPCF